MQSPTVCAAVIARDLPPWRILAVYGVESAFCDSIMQGNLNPYMVTMPPLCRKNRSFAEGARV